MLLSKGMSITFRLVAIGVKTVLGVDLGHISGDEAYPPVAERKKVSQDQRGSEHVVSIHVVAIHGITPAVENHKRKPLSVQSLHLGVTSRGRDQNESVDLPLFYQAGRVTVVISVFVIPRKRW